MHTTEKGPSRRTVLALGAGAALAASLPAGGSAFAASAPPAGSGEVALRLAELEREHSARLGV